MKRSCIRCTSLIPTANRAEPEEIGVEHEAIDGVYYEVRFEDLGDGRTKHDAYRQREHGKRTGRKAASSKASSKLLISSPLSLLRVAVARITRRGVSL